MERRTYLTTVAIAGSTAVAGCLGGIGDANEADGTTDSNEETTMTRTDSGPTGRIGVEIDNQTDSEIDLSVRITRDDTTVDTLDLSVGGESIESFDTAISSPGTYDLQVTTGGRTETLTHAVEQRAIENEREIVVVVYSDKIRSYIQE